MGIPRTGTTLLSNLLACDPARRSPLTWEIDEPVPPATSATLKSDPRAIARLEQEKAMLAARPEMGKYYRNSAVYPNECIFFMAHDFKALALESREAGKVVDQAIIVSCDLVAIRTGVLDSVRSKVAPRLKDLPDIEKFLREQVPEIKFVVGHGQMSATQLEEVMSAFYEGEYDVLVSTTIVESGLDIPTANTLIVHRADMFGLAQLYQIRGRVGRSSRRAYAYLLYRRRERLSDEARKRLQAIFNASELGAGFQIALSDLDALWAVVWLQVAWSIVSMLARAIPLGLRARGDRWLQVAV